MIAALVAAVSLAVYVYAAAILPPGYRSTGVHVFNDNDQLAHYSFMEEARQGRWGARVLYTLRDEQVWAVRMPVWQALGGLARATGCSLPVAYHAGRVAAILFCGLALAWLATTLVPAEDRSRALVLAFTASGLGWLRADFPSWASADHIIKESITFMTLHDAPHTAFALGLIACIFSLALGEARAWRVLAAGGLGALLAVCHPYDVVTVFAVLTLAALPDPAALKRVVAIGLLALPGALWILVTYRLDPILSSWQRNNVMPSTPPLTLVSGFGLLIPLAAAGARARLAGSTGVSGWPAGRSVAGERPGIEPGLRPGPALADARAGDRGARVLALWVAAQALLCYAPVSFQRKLVFGLHIALAFLAASGLRALLPRLRPTGFALVATVLALSNVRHLAHDVRTSGATSPPFAVSEDLEAALGALRAADPLATRVLADVEPAKLVAAFAARRVPWGTEYLENHPEGFVAESLALVRDPGPADRWLAFLARYRITHVLAVESPGPVQRAWERDGLPARLQKMCAGPRAALYAVSSGGG